MTFIEAVLCGKAVAQDVDDWVDRWHNDEESLIQLAEYLGMTHDEYAAWVRNSKTLDKILAYRRALAPCVTPNGRTDGRTDTCRTLP